MTWLILIVFSNQYLLINEEFFIILGFLSLCYIVRTNLGQIVENELSDRKSKVLNSYLEYLNKKSSNYNTIIANINQKIIYFCNFADIQREFYVKFSEFFYFNKSQKILDSFNNTESSFISYFAIFVSNKRKFL